MTIRELCETNEDMNEYSICVIHCRYTNIYDKIPNNDIIKSRRTMEDIAKGCIIYYDEYNVMPEVLKYLNVNSFRCLSSSRSLDKPSKWEIWVM